MNKKTQQAVNVFDKLARQYQDKFMNVGLYADSFDLFCNYLPKGNASILELACGPGNITKYLLDKRPDFRILGSDLAPNMLDLARANNPSATFQLMDCRDIDKLSERYDGVMCGFALPYLSKEEAIHLIASVSKLLHSSGVFYLSTMEDDYSKSGLETSSSGDQVYMHYHEEDYLVQAMKENSLSVRQTQHLDYRGEDGNPTTDLIIISVK